MPNKITTKLKTSMQAFKNNFGYAIYKFMLQCCLISLALLVIMFFLGDVGLNFWGILEFVLSIPLYSIVIAFIRLALRFVRKLLPYGGIVQLIIDIVVSFLALFAIGQVFDVQMPYIVETLLTIAIDLLYIVALFYFRTSPKPEE